MALTNPNSYVTVSGLSEFLTQLKSKYADNSSSSYSVKYASEAAKLQTARNIAFAGGDVTGSFSFDGSADVGSIALSVGEGKITNAMLAGSIEQSKISGLGDALDAKLDDSQLVTEFGATPSDSNIASEKLVKDSLDGKVDTSRTIAGVALTSDISKASLLSAINVADGAQVNVLEGVQFKGSRATEYSDLTIDANKKVQIDLSGYALLSDLTTVFKYMGEKTGAELRALTASDVKTGYIYTCSADDSTGTPVFHKGYEYLAQVSGSTLSWIELGQWIDISGKVDKTQKINNKALSGDITLDGADIALTGYAKGTSSSAIAATDTINAAFGKVENQVDVVAGDLSTHAADTGLHVTAAKQTAWDAKYDKPATGIPSTDMTEAVQTSLGKADTAVQSVATGSANGTIAVDGTDVAVKGLDTAAYKAESYFVKAEDGKRLMTDAEGTKLGNIEAGAQVNKIEAIKMTDSASALTITDKTVTIPAASAIADGAMSSEDFSKLAGISAGANKVEASSTNGNIKVDGSEVTVYTHPAYTAHATAAVYKLSVDAQGHVDSATAAAYADLPITKSDLDGTIGVASASANGLMTSAHFSKLDALTAASNADIDSIFA